MITPVIPSSLAIPSIAPITSPAMPAAGEAFHSVLTDAISKVEGFQNNATQTVNRFLSGDGEELHHVALTAQQAELSFQLFMQVRNKIVTAYQQVMQMQV